MANILNADNGAVSGSAGIKLSSDTSGVLNIQTNGVTAISIAANQVVSFPATVGINFNGQIQFEAGTALIPAISTVADTNTGIYFPGADQIAISTGGVQRFFVGATGDVGIGTGSPGARLDIVNTARIQLRASNSTSAIELWKDATPTFAASIGPGTATGLSSSLKFDIYNGTSWSTAATIDASGNLGLGVTPSAWGTTNLKAFQIGNSAFWNQTNTDNVYLSSNNYYDGTNYKYIISDFAAEYSMTNGRHIWSTAASGTAGNNVTFTEVMRITAGGDVGIGTSSPATKLDVNGITQSRGNLYGGTSNTTANVLAYANVANGGAGFSQFLFANTSTETRGYLTYTHASDALLIGTAGATKATLDSSGNLGIGTTSPKLNTNSGTFLTVSNTTSDQAGWLELQGAPASDGSGSGQVSFNNSNRSGTDKRIAQISALRGAAADSGSIAFTTWNAGTGSERARITSGGNFLVGLTSSSTNQFQVNKAGDQVIYFTNINSSDPYGIYISYPNLSPNNTANYFISCQDSSANRMRVNSNGGIANYQANDINLSDQRVKKDVKPLGSMWDKFKAIEIVTFKYKDQTHDDDNIGVIAQQVESVAPEFIDVDGFGETPEDGVPLKTVYTTDMYHAAIKALQEAMTRIEELEAKVTALEVK